MSKSDALRLAALSVRLRFPLTLRCRQRKRNGGYVQTTKTRTGFYRAMHFSAKRGIAIACRLSVRPSVRPSVCDVGEF